MIYKNIDKNIIEDIRIISRAMFKKNFFGIFHGSISHKLDDNKFIINTNNTIFDDISPRNFITLPHKRDYSWQEASVDSFIHSYIYREINEAKYIAYTLPPFTMAYSLNNDTIVPKDYFGFKKLNKINIYDPKEYSSWFERADVEICNFLKQNKINFIVVRGYGIYIYDKNIYQLAKTIAVIENSVRILLLSNLSNQNPNSMIDYTNTLF